MQSRHFRQYLLRPQRLRWRRLLVQVHLWVGVLVSLYVIVLGLSGSVLVFKDELMPRPAGRHLHPSIDRCQPSELLQAVTAARQAFPAGTLVLALCPTAADPFFAIDLQHAAAATDRHPLTVYVDPVTLTVQGSVVQDASWVGFVDRLHMDLLLRRSGRMWNGIGGALLLLLAATGLVIWWPGLRCWSRGFGVQWRARWQRVNWDLHSAIGIWTLLSTVMWASTTVYFAWPRPLEKAINKVSPVLSARYPVEEIAKLLARPVPPQAAARDDALGVESPRILSMLQQALVLSPEAHLEGFFLGSGRAPLFTIYMARKAMGDYANTDFLYFDQHTGQHLLSWRRGTNVTAGDWLIWLAAPLHFGTSWGLAGKFAWCLLGLSLPALAITGLLMYWNRYLCKVFSTVTSSRPLQK